MNEKNNEDFELTPKNAIKIGVGAVIVILLFSVIMGSFFIVSPGERGILITLGNPADIAFTEGIHFKYPIVQSVVYMDIQTQKYETKASAASSDLQVVSTDIAVNYHLTSDGIVRLYKEIGVDYASRIIQPAVQEVVKSATAHYTAEQLITKRANVKEEIDSGLITRLSEKGIVMETTSITNFDFSAQFNAAIEAKVTQEQNALTAKNKLAQVEYEAQQVVAQANGARDAKIADAQAQAQTKLLNAESEAKALELQRSAITEQLLELRRIEVQSKFADRWNGQLPMYNLGGNTLPIMNIPTSNIAGAIAGQAK